MGKNNKSKEEFADAKLKATIEYYASLYDISYKELSASLGFSLKTLYNRLNNPGDFTKRELEKLKKKFHMKDDELMECIA